MIVANNVCEISSCPVKSDRQTTSLPLGDNLIAEGGEIL